MRLSRADGYLLMDVVVGLALFSFVLLAIYHLYGPTFTLSRDINDRLAAQQDVRLALDRVAQVLHETTLASGRFRVYSAEAGCAGAYEGCLGFVTARNARCTGTFQLINGRANWQATMYLWRDVGSGELRLRCEPGATFPSSRWPPRTLEPFAVVGTHIAGASIALQAADDERLASIAIAIREQARASLHRSPITYFNETVFLPQN